ncbi:MAG TPA: CBS domain-containing protein [Micromonosporaceae bacterium]|nr:CBS domain-containing protein [Micromonosporaceae bacterium]
MKPWRVREVMTVDPVAVGEDASYRQMVDVLAKHRFSAVPVVDAGNRVVGLVSEADLLRKIEFVGGEAEPRLFEGRRQRTARAKATSDIARELMSSPAVTVGPETTVIEAARVMSKEHVKRLPVVDEAGRLVGIVSRGDLLRVHLRPDEEIRSEVVQEVLRKVLWLEPGQVNVSVREGVTTLNGELERRTDAQLAVHLTHAVAGVVDVVDELSYRYDDTELSEARALRSYPFSVR